eukprot:3756530-Rhodomonas_salina.2
MERHARTTQVVAVLERVCSVHDLCYAEASRPTTTEGAAMRYKPLRPLRYLLCRYCPAVSGTELAYGAMRCPVLRQRMVSRCWAHVCESEKEGTSPISLRASYAMSGTVLA